MSILVCSLSNFLLNEHDDDDDVPIVVFTQQHIILAISQFNYFNLYFTVMLSMY